MDPAVARVGQSIRRRMPRAMVTIGDASGAIPEVKMATRVPYVPLRVWKRCMAGIIRGFQSINKSELHFPIVSSDPSR
jgi:hypothetical protein